MLRGKISRYFCLKMSISISISISRFKNDKRYVCDQDRKRIDGKSLLELGYVREFIRRWIGGMKIRKIRAR